MSFKSMVSRLLGGGGSTSKPPAQTPKASTPSRDPRHQFHPLKVARLVRETADSCSLVFEIPPAQRDLFRYKAGQFLTLEIPYQGQNLRRCYSLASSPDTESEHKVTIKRVEDGRISNWINDSVAEGQTIQVLPPDGRFVMHAQSDKMLLFAGGSGITPCISLIKSALATTERTIKLVYCNRDAGSVIFQDELEALQQAHSDRFVMVSRLDDVAGFISESEVGVQCEGFTGAEVFMCGPEAFMNTVEKGIETIGMQMAHVHVERFVSLADPVQAGGAEVHLPAGAVAPKAVSVTLGGETVDVPYVAGKTLLESAVEAKLDAPYSCEEGVCGCCMARLVEGEVHMATADALSDSERKRGYILACQARPITERCSIEFDV